jgi:hypothetical protein
MQKFRTTRSFSFCWYVWFAMCSTENSIQMVLLTPLSKEHYVTKSSETEQYAKHHTFSLPHDLIHVFIPCARLRTYIHLKPTTQPSRLKMLQIQFEINFSNTLCFKFSVFQQACRRQLAWNIYSIQHGTYQIQISSPTM